MSIVIMHICIGIRMGEGLTAEAHVSLKYMSWGQNHSGKEHLKEYLHKNNLNQNTLRTSE